MESQAQENGGEDDREAARPARGFRFVDSGRGVDPTLDVLSTWSALEALSPKSYREPKDYAEGNAALGPLEPRLMPWQVGEEPREGYVHYHRIHLGSIDLRRASAAIQDVYGHDEERDSPLGHYAVLGMALVDRRGAPVPRGFSVSSFGWALPLALGKDLERMGRWGEVEADTLTSIANLLTGDEDEDGEPRDPDLPSPVTWAGVMAAHEHIVKRFGIPREMVIPPSFSLCIEHRAKSATTPSPFLLNSFYLSDIDAAFDLVAKGAAPGALRGYLGLDRPGRPIDVLANRNALTQLLSPSRTPLARWPSPGGHPLVTLQQAAVNAAMFGLGETEGTLAVNGPPGTGKTTLLRDIVAANVLRRAIAMAEFEDPDEAFEPVSQEGYGRHLSRLHPTLRGFEMLVASSNNKAVENVSRELPLARNVAGGTEGPRYFRSTSDFLAGISLDPKAEPADPESRTWGLVAAPLGNAGNRASFLRKFWWNDDHGIRSWLRIARGQSVNVDVKDKKGRITHSRPSYLVDAESPPMGWAATRKRWASVRRRFHEALDAAMAESGRLARCEADLSDLQVLRSEAEATAREAEEARSTATPADALQARRGTASRALDEARAALDAHEGLRPSDEGTEFEMWDVERDELAHRIEGAERSLDRLTRSWHAEASRTGTGDGGRYAEAKGIADACARKLAAREAEIEAMRAERRGGVVDEAYFEAGHDAWNRASPWFSEAEHANRDALFGLAMEVHQAFVLAAAKPMQSNLSAFADLLGNGGVPREVSENAAELWASLFLVVPVVSTTFASIGRMLNGLPPASLGWLVVDEAGQAMPQSAVGALMRCKRAVIVGDPLQVEPVAPLPRRLSDKVCEHFRVNPAGWVGPEASVQALADRASPLKGTFTDADGDREVGMPLLVHRRCLEPMFSIANRIAYNGLMVSATPPSDGGAVAAALGDSAWIDVTGSHAGKWCPAQGDAVAGMLARIAAAGIERPDVYVISPFREVAYNMRRRLLREAQTFARFGIDPVDWVRDRVGTIHTFQGREAQAVVLVLGAGEADHVGARTWAGRTPNIANVAVTRAKERLYVVGCSKSWAGTGAFAYVAGAVPVAVIPGIVREEIFRPAPRIHAGPAPRLAVRAQPRSLADAIAAAVAPLPERMPDAASEPAEETREVALPESLSGLVGLAALAGLGLDRFDEHHGDEDVD